MVGVASWLAGCMRFDRTARDSYHVQMMFYSSPSAQSYCVLPWAKISYYWYCRLTIACPKSCFITSMTSSSNPV